MNIEHCYIRIFMYFLVYCLISSITGFTFFVSDHVFYVSIYVT